MNDFLIADKPYAITADGKIVSPQHPAARQILAHKMGQEVATAYLMQAGIADKNGILTPREYDDVPVPVAQYGVAVPEGYISKSESDAAIAAAVADALAKRDADAKNAKGALAIS